ncbi:UNVERIFIED_CONTAM: hypothetical protein PYX00_007888 [Menopon gallinae]|uniref:Glutathione synthetase n=1 Tax=Menopon gallinae TaxID=328185 RepID=A0AAW2HM19_9NEOP
MEAPQMVPCVPVPLDERVFPTLVSKAKDWALMHGAAMRSKTNFSLDSLNFAPFALIPSTFPRKEFEKAVNIQIVLNELIHKVAHDHQFLSEQLRSTIKVDEFTNRLFQLYETVHREGVAQPVSLGLIRSDVMLETTCRDEGISKGCTCSECKRDPNAKLPSTSAFCCWKQVEINTIASGFGHLGPISGAIHRFVLEELGRADLLDHLPENNALTGLCEGLIEAWKIYNNKKAVILFIVEDVTYNICDQRFHEFEIRKLNPQVRVIRRTLTEVFDTGHMTDRRQLVIEDMEVAVVYFRSGYEPSQYHSEKEWDARLLIERSTAIKCPAIHYHLAGTKKVQEALARPLVLEKFLNNPKEVELVREIFTGIYSLDFDQFGNEAVELALRDPEKFVLKPQREGGGNNIYGLDVKRKMEEMINSQERSAWILMARIIPPVQDSYIIRPGVEAKYNELQQVVSELGIFGVIIGDSKEIHVNRQVGHMLRTKLSTANEGGVAAGDGCLDSPFLVD